MYTSPPSSSYSSPPPPNDPYRASPIPVTTRQPYASAFSPPPMQNGGYGQMSGHHGHPNQQQQRQQYTQYSSRSQGGQQRYQSPQMPSSQPGYGNGVPAQPSQLPPAKHKGTLAPGQIVKVGEHTVRIERYLSEGGYAHVYLTTSNSPIYPPTKGEKKGRWGERGYTQHCLKRIAFEDEAVWADVRKEIEVMKALPPNPHLTQYLGSAHSKLPKGGYEVFILMEFCAGGGIIDLLNKRLRDRLKEVEILNIFTDVCEAVAAMHALSRPLLHRDLKIENVLSSPSGQGPTSQRPTALTFKLCDFGSTTFPSSQPPQTKLEADALVLDLNKHTTLQYRSPEMVEPMLGWAVGLPSDVWALGVLLYKLCYYTTPFEEHGTLAIVNAKYTFPQYPVYSPRLQHLIASMLVEQPVRRPTVFEILKTAHEMNGTKPEVHYDTPSRSFTSSSQPPKPPKPSSSSNLLDFTSTTSPIDRSTPALQPDFASAIQPQRRGRPTREPSQKAIPQVVSPTPPMPTPPNIYQPQPKPPSTQLNAPKLQVTGEKQKSSPKPAGRLDAFGVPSLPTAPLQSSPGFGDSFGVPVSSTGQRSGAPAQRSPSGFGDSFGAAPPSSGSKAPMKSGLSPTDHFPTSFGVQRTTSPSAFTSANARKSPDPSSSIPDGEVSFETRFPSIETLSSSDTFSPPLQPSASRPGSTQPRLISPITSPPVREARKPSMMGNLTGGDMANHHLSAQTGAPQPRSTHVTGTAFKGIQGGMLSPNPSTVPSLPSSDITQPKKDYFDSVSDSISPVPTSAAPKSPVPEDLMTGDDNERMGGSSLMRPTLSSSASSSRPLPRPPSATPTNGTTPASAHPAQTAPTFGHSRPLLPHIDSVKPASNINSESWSPLENLRKAQEHQKDDSSDEEGPEDPSALRRTGSSSRTGNRLANRMSAFEIGNKTSSPRNFSPEKQKSFTSPLAPSSSRPDNQRFNSAQRSRPQSMYALPSSSSQGAVPSSLNSAGLPASTQRPGHVRKGSINDIVSKFENLNSPPLPTSTSSGSNPGGTGGNSTGVQRKPSVVAKPVALRKPTADERSTPVEKVQDEKSKPSSPVKAKSVPVKPSKPDMIRPPSVKYGETSQPPGYSKSSSGRSFPVSKPNPVSMPSTGKDEGISGVARKKTPLDTASAQANANGGSATGQSSPEKQQPVNLLIQRWNQGHVGQR